MEVSLFELRIMFLLEDFSVFYYNLKEYYRCLNEYRKNGYDPKEFDNIEDLGKLHDSIKSSTNITNLQKKKAFDLINKIYLLIHNFKTNVDYSKFNYDDTDILRKISENKIDVPTSEKEKMNFKVNYYKFKYQLDQSKIFTLDKNGSITFEQAYGLRFDGKYYFFDIYLPDVLTFFENNRNVFKTAYERGETIYDKNHKYDMIPYPNIIEHLSFKTNAARNSIRFSFVIDKKGRIIHYDIDPVCIRVKKHMNDKIAKQIIQGQTKDDCSILLLKDLVSLPKSQENKGNNSISITDLVGFSSIFLNRFISDKCDYLIFTDNNKFVSKPTNYVNVSTPIRKIVSDINLALFLNHKGYFRLEDKDLYYYMDNKEEIIEHLNDRKKLASFMNRFPNCIR